MGLIGSSIERCRAAFQSRRHCQEQHRPYIFIHNCSGISENTEADCLINRRPSAAGLADAGDRRTACDTASRPEPVRRNSMETDTFMSKARTTICDTDRQNYKHWTQVQLRYGDTDRQGHINNAVYCTLFESGRVAFLFDESGSVAGNGRSFVIAKLSLDFLNEMNFPGVCDVGSKVTAIGNSSFTVGQAIFKDGICCSTAESVIVLTCETTRRSSPLTEDVRRLLQSLM